MMPLAFEEEDRVHNVFERLGACEAAVLRDVADEEGRGVLTLCREQQLRGGFADLADAAGSRLEPERIDRLDRIDNDERRFDARNLLENAFQTRFRQEEQRRIPDLEAFTAGLDLMFGFLTRAVEDGPHGA